MLTEETDPRLVCYDDVWVFDLTPRPLNESSEKWVTPEVQRDRDKKRQNKLGDPEFVRRMKTVTTQSMTEWQQYQRSLWYDLQRLFHGYLQHNVTPIELERQSAIMIRDAYVKAYKLGLASSELRRKTGSTPVRTKADTEWVKKAYRTAMQEWRAFVHKFVTRNLGGTHWPDRIRAFIHQIDTAFQSARSTTIGADTLIFWVGPHDHRTCPSCSLLFANNPYTRDTLPTAPRAGATQCRCLSDILVDIHTSRGNVFLRDVRVGDLVLTHRGRWRRVTEKHEFRSSEAHRYAVIVGEGGKLFGVTDDHPVWTSFGWVSAKEASENGLRVQGLRETDFTPSASVHGLRGGLPVALSVRQTSEDALEAVRFETPSDIRAVVAPSFQSRYGSTEVRAVLGRRGEESDLDLPVAVGACARGDPTGLRRAPYRRGRVQQRIDKPSDNVGGGPCFFARGCSTGSAHDGVDMRGMRSELSRVAPHSRVSEVLFESVLHEISCQQRDTHMFSVRKAVRTSIFADCDSGENRTFLLEALLRRASAHSDSVVCMLREGDSFSYLGEHQSTCVGQVVAEGQVLLLEEMLPVGSPLYDLTVEEDHSFVANGVVIHNSNCRDHLLVRQATPEEIADVLGGRDPRKIKAALIRKLTAVMQPGMTYNASSNRPMKKKGYKPRKLPVRPWVAQDHNFF